MQPQETDHTRLFLAIFLAAITLIAWQALVQAPRKQQLAEYAKTQEVKRIQEKQAYEQTVATSKKTLPEENADLTPAQRLALSPRVEIRSAKLDGTIALKGARFDNLHLANYREELDPKSPEVTLLYPNGDEQSYFAQIGWVSADGKTIVPDQHSVWQSDGTKLTPDSDLNLFWDNGAGVRFHLSIALDKDYMFSIRQYVENNSGQEISLAPYAYINRAFEDQAQHYGILHEGPIGVMDGALEEIGYEELRDDGPQKFDNASGWLGITDKYWLTALIPAEHGYKATMSHYKKYNRDRYQVDYLGTTVKVANGNFSENKLRFFAGAKEINALDRYADGGEGAAPITLFDRAVDFGFLYFMTKPMFLTLHFFYDHIGNFGLAIMLLTVVIKLIMFPLANKSYHSMAQMRAVQPQIKKIRERHAGDTMTINKEMMELYKREKINPASGCLPVLIQMPVFFALYKVLYVTIEMRHAPFFGWLKDLSAPDPSNLFTLFGIMPWDHPASLHLGILPILFCVTMIIQMKQQPKPADPVQAKVMGFMPYLFLFIFAGFPAGLVVYWVWSNMLSILQQQFIIRHHNAKEYRKTAS